MELSAEPPSVPPAPAPARPAALEPPGGRPVQLPSVPTSELDAGVQALLLAAQLSGTELWQAGAGHAGTVRQGRTVLPAGRERRRSGGRKAYQPAGSAREGKQDRVFEACSVTNRRLVALPSCSCFKEYVLWCFVMRM